VSPLKSYQQRERNEEEGTGDVINQTQITNIEGTTVSAIFFFQTMTHHANYSFLLISLAPLTAHKRGWFRDIE
jgi:hypothetical protein